MSTVLHTLLKIAEEQRLVSDDFARALSFAKVRALKAAGQHADGGGLVLHVSAAGSKSWRYRFRLDGAPQTLTIGSFPAVGLEEARTIHRAARWLVARGMHPLKHAEGEIERAHAEAQARTENTFRAVAEDWMSATEANLALRTIKHRKAMLEKHVFPTLADRPIKEIVRKELRDLLTELDKVAPVTARHCLGYISRVFEYAEDAELVQANPTPRTGVLVNAMKRSVKPRKALPLNRLGEFLRTLEDARETDPATKAAMKLLVLTWCRTTEVTAARWAEFDLDAGIWTIPAERMKAGEPHTVRLSRQAVELLTELRERSKGEVLFPNRRKPGKTMSRTTLFQWRTRWGFADVMDVHGLRAVASTWANESGKYRPDVIEVALAHKEGDRVRAAYNRAEFAAEVRRLWQDWADVCDEKLKITRAQNVLELPKAAA